MNIFRLVGDITHVVAVLVLLSRIIYSRSCAGISGRSQLLFTLTYLTRYVDLFYYFISVYNTTFKIIYVVASCLTTYLVFLQFRSTYEYKKDTFRIWLLLAAAMMLAFLFNHSTDPLEILWTFSIYLEPVAILPQCYMIAKIGSARTTVVYYMLSLWVYRSFYIINWVYRYYENGYYDVIAIAGGITQTLIFGKFFYHFGDKLFGSREVGDEPWNKKIENSEWDAEDRDLDSEDDEKPSQQQTRMVMECCPGCFDSLLAPPYHEQLDHADFDKLWQPVKVIQMEPGKEKECLKTDVLLSDKV